jgi:hypothetical protein
MKVNEQWSKEDLTGFQNLSGLFMYQICKIAPLSALVANCV